MSMGESRPLAVPPEPTGATGVAPDGALPRLLPGVVLGELDTSSSRQAYLLTLPDGRHFQLAAPLYHLATLLDGTRTAAEVAAELSTRIGREVTVAEVETVIARKLAPLGILVTDDMLPPGPGFDGWASGRFAPPAPDAALGVLARLPVVPDRYLQPLAEALKHLYRPALALPLLFVIALAHVYAYQQLAPRLAPFDPFSVPIMAFVLVPLLVQLTTPWHELGHAAAARYFGARHGPLGVGLMGLALVAFVEVTDIWRLPRRQRLVVDLGGVYFQAMSVVPLALWAGLTGDQTPLWTVLALDFAMLMNLNPLFKLDGYWAVSDATGIPNLHQRVGQQLGHVAATALLAVARGLRLRPLREHPGLQAAAAASEALATFGGGARLALALYSVLFLLSALYFVLMLVFILPMLIAAYPLLALNAWLAVNALVGGTPDPSWHVLALLQFAFVTLLFVALVGSVLPLLLALLGRTRRVPGWGMDWRMPS
ncbi:MAG TPA: hypothetical protein VFB73_12700 [Chloroflexota bacterium]|nr:hypothetical protein [Chloroflexota bacterium]